ncbi:MAG TPA: hypothetical protein VM674_01305 [Candidatus Acidoferrum sp.]|nr:hypothetical protein [Candidatus Acidoferrum sp.]
MLSTRPFASETRLLFRTALVIFIVTVGIGIFNGFHFIQLSRAVLLTHVHAGTLGWITLVATGAAFWLFSDAGTRLRGHARGVAVGMAIAVPVYVLAFLSGNLPARAIFGVPVLLLILGIAVFLFRAAGVGLSVPRLGVLLAFVTLIIGSTLGVLVQIELAANHVFLPEGAIGGHASAQVGGYLVLFALSAIEWRLKGADDFGWAGRIQVLLLFVGGLLLAVGVLFNVQPLLGSFIPLDLIALVIFLVRVGPALASAQWTEAGSSRHYAIAVPWAVLNLLLTIWFIVLFIGAKGDFSKLNTGILIAADHSIFLGVMTNMAFGLMHDFALDRPQVWPWAEQVIFWVLNLALVGFVVSLITQAQWAEKFFTPFQGLAILVGIVAFSLRLASGAEISPGALRRTAARA